MAQILLVEDEASMRRILQLMLSDDGHSVMEAASIEEGRIALSQFQFDLVISDQRLPDGEGLQILQFCNDSDWHVPLIMITAFATVDLAVSAMRLGAFDFITKPFKPEAVLAAVHRAVQHTKLLRENVVLKNEVNRLHWGKTRLLGGSAPIQQVKDQIARVASTDATALICGETGTGKELVARLIHEQSGRHGSAFVAVNCAAMPESLLESQLFGHEKGAFTGATQARQGLFDAAHMGSLFLDEAGEMPLSLQAKLLRVLMDGEIMRVGSNQPRKVDVRIIVATHRNLQKRLKEGHFREDLYYRLAVVPIEVPALRERREDIPLLIEHFRKLVASDLKCAEKALSAQAQEYLCQYDFPGNVRELRNLIERAYILGGNDNIELKDLSLPVPSNASNHVSPDGHKVELKDLNLRAHLEKIEEQLIAEALQESAGNQAEAARHLGISRSDMNYKVKKYNLHP